MIHLIRVVYRRFTKYPTKGDKTDCNNYRGMSLLSTSYKILLNNLLSMLSPCTDEITGDHQCGFWRNRSTTVQIFCIRRTLEKNGSAMKRYIIYSRKPRFTEFGVPTKLVRLIKVCLNEMYSKVYIGKHLSDNWCSVPLLFNLALRVFAWIPYSADVFFQVLRENFFPQWVTWIRPNNNSTVYYIDYNEQCNNLTTKQPLVSLLPGNNSLGPGEQPPSTTMDSSPCQESLITWTKASSKRGRSPWEEPTREAKCLLEDMYPTTED
jgi:hypothetical protein